jgi:CRISPR-associated protein Cas2
VPAEGERYMWLMVFFDLPVRTKEQRKVAAHFRKDLVKDGYIMLQLSVYARLCQGEERVEKHIQRLKANTPSKGHIRVMKVTDRQYGRMLLLSGKRSKNEEKRSHQLVLF